MLDFSGVILYTTDKARAKCRAELYVPAIAGAVAARCFPPTVEDSHVCTGLSELSLCGCARFQMNFYRSARWERKRAKILRRDGYLCQISRRYGKTVPADTVHHIFPRDEFPEYQLSDWNLISLSASVHDTMHDRSSGRLSPAGAELLRRTCRKYGKEIPEQYKE